jgi:hypothetical protein
METKSTYVLWYGIILMLQITNPLPVPGTTYPGNFDESVKRPVEVLGPVVPLAVADLLGGVESQEGRVTVHPRAEVIHQPVAVHETLLPEHHALRLQPANIESRFKNWHSCKKKEAVLRLRIHVFLGLLDPDPGSNNPDPSISKQKMLEKP